MPSKTGRGGLWQLWSSGLPAPEFTEPLCVTRSSCCCHPQEPPESDSKKSRRGKILLQSGLTLNSYLGRYILGLYSRHTRFYLGCNILTICSSCDMTCRLKCLSFASHLGMLKMARLAELNIFQLQVEPSLVWTMQPCLGPRA